MSQISFLRVNNFIGVDELEVEPSKINIFKGPKGAGKTTVIESIEKTFLNKDRRTEVIKHGSDEATIYIETNDGLSIDRRVRKEKADYLKLRQDEGGIKSSEKFLKDLVNGNIFRPLDWINLSVREQTKSLLSMLEIGWNKDDITNWFGDLPGNIDYDQHILLILKSIETQYYNEREEVNRKVKELKAQIKVIVDDLPAEYNGEEWKDKNVQEYYNKVKEAQDINRWIAEARALKENFDSKVESLKANGESEKSRITLRYKSESEDIKDILTLSKSKIEKTNDYINSADRELDIRIQELTNKSNSETNATKDTYSKDLKVLEEEFAIRKKNLEETYKFALDAIDNSLNENIESAKKQLVDSVAEQKDLISIQNNKIAAKEQELLGIDSKEKTEKNQIDEKVKSEIEKEEIRIGKASTYLEEHKEIQIESLQEEANKVQEMVSYLREWDKISEIRDNQLAPKERYANELTARIEKARTLPGELLRTANMPVEGISVDVDGRVRIDGTLIDGLSDGEKLELAMKVAKAQCGELKVICLDKFESLDMVSREKLLEEMKNDEYQYFVTQVVATETGEVEIEKIGEVI
ncbi:hypothetical protein [Clostridium sp. HBUAS56017]|uniref:hypothetical protein n=1 Tax=Clostridium sp. HBUAS56017 TaxID=2571128 RepID=UPI0011788A36|nr:hypothetical protein [Clostridium sp. HBUAS56017]